MRRTRKDLNTLSYGGIPVAAQARELLPFAPFLEGGSEERRTEYRCEALLKVVIL
jgi:hypothetical protein